MTDLAERPAVTVPTEVGQRPFDADNHYYEALDAFTRHLDPAWGPRTVQWSEIDGRKYHVVGGRVSRAVVNPTFDPVAKPGVLRDYFRGNPNGDDPIELLRARDRIDPAYRDRDARPRTSWPRWCATSCSPGSPTCASRRSRTARGSCAR